MTTDSARRSRAAVAALSRIFLQHVGGGIAGSNGHGNYAAACGFHFFAADNLVAGPVAAFDKYVREEGGDNFARRWFIENDDGVDAFERGENFRAFLFRKHRAAGTFELANTSVTI